MRRIAIIGSSGAGKSTLARKLRLALNIRAFHLDRLFWKCGWGPRSHYERVELLERLVFGEKQWIIEGNYLKLFESALKEADTIIFLDLPPLLCLQGIIKRHYETRGLSRCDIPEGCTDRFTLRHLLKTLAFPVYGRRMIEQMLHKCPPKHVIRLHSKKEMERFLARLKQIEEGDKALAVRSS